jgi:hypothetical protein
MSFSIYILWFSGVQVRNVGIGSDDQGLEKTAWTFE